MINDERQERSAEREREMECVFSDWPLLYEIRAFVGRERWEEDQTTIDDIEWQICRQTEIGWWFEEQKAGDRDTPRFLRSRDASAMLEEAVHARDPLSWVEVQAYQHMVDDEDGDPPFCKVKHHLDECSFGNFAATEPLARTLSALEAGRYLGLW